MIPLVRPISTRFSRKHWILASNWMKLISRFERLKDFQLSKSICPSYPSPHFIRYSPEFWEAIKTRQTGGKSSRNASRKTHRSLPHTPFLTTPFSIHWEQSSENQENVIPTNFQLNRKKSRIDANFCTFAERKK